MNGNHLHDTTGADRAAIIPELIDRDRYNEDGVGGAHIYTPWWLDNKTLNFPRGNHLEYWGGMTMPSYGIGFGMDHLRKLITDEMGNPQQNGGYGIGLKKIFGEFMELPLEYQVEGNQCLSTTIIVKLTRIPWINTVFQYLDFITSGVISNCNKPDTCMKRLKRSS